MRTIALFILLLLAGFGCRTSDSDTPPAVTNSVRRWSQGITMSFPGTPRITMSFPGTPTENTSALLKLAKFKESSERVYVLERWDMNDQLQTTAIQTALREGAVLVSPPSP